jgi:FG-GAP-like repeat
VKRAAPLLLACATAAAAPAQTFPEAPQFGTERLQVPGRLLSVHAEDLDGDGRRDIIAPFVVGAPPSTQRKIAIFLDHGDKRGFAAAPDHVLAAPAAASFIDVADVDGDARAEILFGDARGIGYFAPGPDGWSETRRLVAIEGLALLPDEEDLPWIDVARDWNGDGRAEILLPTVDRIAVITRSAGGDTGWARTGELRLTPRARYLVRSDAYEPRASNYSVRVAVTVPELHLADWDGDGRRDLVAVLDDTVTVFKGQAEGLFGAAAAAKIHLGARTEAEAARGNAALQTSVVDLDGDGVADLVVNKVVGGLGTMHAQIGFYYGKRGGGYGRPALVLSREGYAGALLFGDLDGDKRPEMVMCHTTFGFGEAVQVVLRRRLFVSFGVHKNLGSKGFSAKPEIDLPIDFAVEWANGAELDGPFPSLEGDFNGDGRVDLVGPKGDGAIGVWLSGGRALVDEYPKAIVHVPLSHHWKVLDLDGDKRADVILFYRFRADRQGQILVLRNTGRGW